METTINTGIKQQQASGERSAVSTVQYTIWQKMEESRFGIIPMLLVFLVCVGGIATAYGTGDNTFQLGLVVFPTIITLAMILAVAPMKNIFYLSVLALVADLLVFMI